MAYKLEDKNFIYTTPIKKNIKYFLKKILFPFFSFFYKIVLFFNRKHKKVEKKYDITICGIFKNEAKYLKEWLDFHLIVGVQHFYLYNNNSSDDYLMVLNPYIAEGTVELIEWKKDHSQMEAYRDCILRFAQEAKWIGFIDIDEFVIPNDCSTIYECLKPFEHKRPAVMIYWKIYGSAGKIERNRENLVIEDFTVCWRKYINIGKCFYNTNYKFDFKTNKNSALHHCLWCKVGGITIPPVNIFDNMSFSTRHKINKGRSPIQINHYFTKSYNEYCEKSSRGDVYYQLNPYNQEYFFKYESRSEDVDYCAYKYLLKTKMFGQTKYNKE